MPQKRYSLPKGHLDGLADALANNKECRERMLQGHTLLRWPSPKQTGKVTQKALKMNVDVLLVVGSILCPQSPTQIAVNVGPPKKEVRKLRQDLKMEPDPANVVCEGHAIKGFVTLTNRRLYASSKRRDPELQRVYAFFRSHWPGPDILDEGELEDEPGDDALVEYEGDDIGDDGYEELDDDFQDALSNMELRQSFWLSSASSQHPAELMSSADNPTPEHKVPVPPLQTPTDPSPPSAPALKRKAAFVHSSNRDVRQKRIEYLKLKIKEMRAARLRREAEGELPAQGVHPYPTDIDNLETQPYECTLEKQDPTLEMPAAGPDTGPAASVEVQDEAPEFQGEPPASPGVQDKAPESQVEPPASPGVRDEAPESQAKPPASPGVQDEAPESQDEPPASEVPVQDEPVEPESFDVFDANDSLTRLDQQQQKADQKSGRGRGGRGRGGRGRGGSMKRPAAAVKPAAKQKTEGHSDDKDEQESENESNAGTVRYAEQLEGAAEGKDTKPKEAKGKSKRKNVASEPAAGDKRTAEPADENPQMSKTFARRYCPKGGPNKEKWTGLRAAYYAAVSSCIVSPSKMEDHFFKFFTAWYPKETLTGATADRYKCLALQIVPEYLQQEALKDLVKEDDCDE